MNLSQFIEWLATNPWLIITSFIITIISLPLVIFFYFKSKKDKKLYYAILSHNIVRDLVSRIDSLEMLYAGERIENITVTKIAFWNAGNDTIKGQDIKKPLTVTVENGYKILKADQFYIINKENKFSINLSDDKSHIIVDFDYLDKNQGEIIQLYHNGKSENDIKIDGYIMGSGAPIHKNAIKVLDSISLIHLGLWLGLPVFFIVITVADGSIFENIKAIAFFLIMSLVMVYLILKDRLPKRFEKFQDEILK